tara:strand:+ start:274 stop:1230 length:957 start_codon:yes stop_codon:yes gene_type:complete
MELLEELPKATHDRIKGQKYLYKNEIKLWNGRNLHTICEHNKRKYDCIICKGSNVCIHKKIKSDCRICSPQSFCKHNKRKTVCKECNGGSICIHNKRRYECIICEGNGICNHGKKKSKCKKCSPNNSSLCTNCKYVCAEKKYISKTDTYVKLCADCFYKLYPDEKNIPTKYKRKQHYIHEKIKEKYGEDFFKYDVKVECGCSKKIPDWFVDCFNFSLTVECDENQHKKNESSCENNRLCELFLDCASRPFVCIRFNPDSYKIEEKNIEGCFTFDNKNNIVVNQEEFDKRFDKLVEKIDYYLENGSEKNIECIKLFYDT